MQSKISLDGEENEPAPARGHSTNGKCCPMAWRVVNCREPRTAESWKVLHACVMEGFNGKSGREFRPLL